MRTLRAGKLGPFARKLIARAALHQKTAIHAPPRILEARPIVLGWPPRNMTHSGTGAERHEQHRAGNRRSVLHPLPVEPRRHGGNAEDRLAAARQLGKRDPDARAAAGILSPARARARDRQYV